mmetsp:Transcript_5409/g.5536  ORF Transcript_5409/g.5536 Transcript_5409/m.5536 type:complete len:563 (+) Transcript_5409:31-1719(+)
MMSYNQNKTLEDLKLLQETINHIKLQISILKDIQIRNLQEDNNNNNTGIEEGNNNDYYYSSGDTAWMIFATILVIFMTLPGIMIYYAGMVRLQNALSTAMQGFGLVCVITFLWLCFGYSLSFGPSHSKDVNAVIFGDSSRFWLHGIYHSNTYHDLAPTIPESVFCCFQLAFAIITPTLICGAFADRMKYLSVLISLGLWHLVVYCPIAHSNWHPDGFLHKAGVLDFAGGNVVHISAGVSALVSAIIVGKRGQRDKEKDNKEKEKDNKDKEKDDKEEENEDIDETKEEVKEHQVEIKIKIEKEKESKKEKERDANLLKFLPHNLLLSLVGSCFLIVGWFGFNAGSAFGANGLAGFSMINTLISSALASLSWMTCDILRTGKPTLDGVMNGFIAGLVGITPAAGFVTPSGSFVIGIITGGVCCFGVKIKDIFDFDDSLDAFGIHAIAGVVGGILTGLLASEQTRNKLHLHGVGYQFGLQLLGIVATATWAAIGTFLVMYLVDKTFGLRVDKNTEARGLDLPQVGSTLTAQASKATPRNHNNNQCSLHFCCCVLTCRPPQGENDV